MSCTEKFKRRKWRNRELRRCCGCLSNPILFFSPIFVCWSYIHTGLHPFFLLRSLLSDSWHLCGSKGEKKNKIKTRQSSKEKKKKSEKNVRLWDPGWWMMTRLEKRTGNLCAPWPSYLFSYEKKKKENHSETLPYVCVHGRRPSSPIREHESVSRAFLESASSSFYFCWVCQLIDSSPSQRRTTHFHVFFSLSLFSIHLLLPHRFNGKDPVASRVKGSSSPPLVFNSYVYMYIISQPNCASFFFSCCCCCCSRVFSSSSMLEGNRKEWRTWWWLSSLSNSTWSIVGSGASV